jgi:tripartite-type tricarboxylate transporter receptor subunit TctC
MTPVQMLALDQFVLWVNQDSPYKTPKDLIDAMRTGAPGSFKLGGTGSKQEDLLISVLLETAASTPLNYVPLKGGGDDRDLRCRRRVSVGAGAALAGRRAGNRAVVPASAASLSVLQPALVALQR